MHARPRHGERAVTPATVTGDRSANRQSQAMPEPIGGQPPNGGSPSRDPNRFLDDSRRGVVELVDRSTGPGRAARSAALPTEPGRKVREPVTQITSAKIKQAIG
jgi:hypothetical protein